MEIYWEHDLKNFDKVSEFAKKIYEALGFEELVAQNAGNFISKAYQLADRAETAKKEGNKKSEFELYIEASEELRKAEKVLGYVASTAKNQVNWWRFFRHKNLLLAFWNLFIQHTKPLGLKGMHKALCMTIILTKVGLCHNKRDKESAISEAKKYWELLLIEDTGGCPYLG